MVQLVTLSHPHHHNTSPCSVLLTTLAHKCSQKSQLQSLLFIYTHCNLSVLTLAIVHICISNLVCGPVPDHSVPVWYTVILILACTKLAEINSNNNNQLQNNASLAYICTQLGSEIWIWLYEDATIHSQEDLVWQSGRMTDWSATCGQFGENTFWGMTIHGVT